MPRFLLQEQHLRKDWSLENFTGSEVRCDLSEVCIKVFHYKPDVVLGVPGG